MKPETFDAANECSAFNCESADEQLNASTTPTRYVMVCVRCFQSDGGILIFPKHKSHDKYESKLYSKMSVVLHELGAQKTRSSAVAERPRDALCH